jgi:hypothetical protein
MRLLHDTPLNQHSPVDSPFVDFKKQRQGKEAPLALAFYTVRF